MKIALIYIHVPHDPEHVDLACRFVATYNHFPPMGPHDTVVVCNGSPPTAFTKMLFASLPNLSFLDHDDSGWDIGAYQKAAREVPCDMMIFCGGSLHFVRPAWLHRMASAFIKQGPGLYGAMGNAGDLKVNVQPHIRTTGFWTCPQLFNAYPIRVTRQEQRYEFEHGKTCLTSWMLSQGKKVMVVTWNGEYVKEDWDRIPNGFHRGDQSALIVKDRLACPPYYAK